MAPKSKAKNTYLCRSLVRHDMTPVLGSPNSTRPALHGETGAANMSAASRHWPLRGGHRMVEDEQSCER